MVTCGHARRASIRDAMRQVACRSVWLLLQGLRWSAYGVLAILRPILIPLFYWLAVGGVLLWIIFVPIAHDADFPTLRVLGMSAGCAAGAVVYYALMDRE